MPSPAGSSPFSARRLRQRERPGRAADADPDVRPADRDCDQHGDAGPAHGDRDPADCDGHPADGNADQRSADCDPCPANPHSDTDGHADSHTDPDADLRRAGTGRLQLPDAHADRQPVRTRTGRMPDADARSHFDADPSTDARTGWRRMTNATNSMESNSMALSLPEVIGFVPKTTALVVKAVNTVGQIRQLPEKNAKTVAAVLGIAEGSLLHDIIDLTDDIIEASKS